MPVSPFSGKTSAKFAMVPEKGWKWPFTACWYERCTIIYLNQNVRLFYPEFAQIVQISNWWLFFSCWWSQWCQNKGRLLESGTIFCWFSLDSLYWTTYPWDIDNRAALVVSYVESASSYYGSARKLRSSIVYYCHLHPNNCSHVN